MRILMAADGSKHGTADLLSACRILASRKHEFHLLCVAPAAPLAGKAGKTRTALQEKVKRRAQRIAAGMQLRMAEEGAQAAALVRVGSPLRVLLRESQQYDLTVLGATSHGNSGYPGLGPVTSRLVEHATDSVLLAREGIAEESLRILAPLDGTESSFYALRRLGEMVSLDECEITLLHVVETPWFRILEEEPEEEPHNRHELQADLESELTKEGEAILEAGRDCVPGRAVVNTVLNRGVPADEILSEAQSGNYDLLMLAAAAEPEHAFKHRMLGAVSARVAWNAPCSVLLVRGG